VLAISERASSRGLRVVGAAGVACGAARPSASPAGESRLIAERANLI